MAAIKQGLQGITMQQMAGSAFVSTPSTPATSQKTKEQWLNEGSILMDRTLFQEALTAFEQAIRLDPNLAVAYDNKSWALNNLMSQ